jgi:hypothetical protein
VKELITSSYFDTKKGTTHIEINTYFDSLGRNVKIAYFVKGDSTPYKKELIRYSKDFKQETTFENVYGKMDTTKVITSLYQNELVQSEDILRFGRYELNFNGVSEIKENKTESKLLYSYDSQGNLISKKEEKDDELNISESNSYKYGDEKRVVEKHTISPFFNKELTSKSFFEYDSFGTLAKEIIVEDTITVTHYYSSGLKNKSEMEFERQEGKLIFLYDYEGKLIVIKGKKDKKLSLREYEYDTRGNWIKRYDFEQIEGEPKVFLRSKGRKIVYRN